MQEYRPSHATPTATARPQPGGSAARPAVPDEELYTRFTVHGERAAIETLVRRWHGAAYRVSRCLCPNDTLAEEAQQNAFLELTSARSPFENRRPGSFRAWFLRLVANKARMVMRCERRAQRKKRAAFIHRCAPYNGTTSVTFFDDLRAELRQVLARVEERWRTPVELHFLDGLTQREVASRLGVSQQMVSRRIARGLELLRILMA